MNLLKAIFFEKTEPPVDGPVSRACGPLCLNATFTYYKPPSVVAHFVKLIRVCHNCKRIELFA